jgi:hypothetical protein
LRPVEHLAMAVEESYMQPKHGEGTFMQALAYKSYVHYGTEASGEQARSSMSQAKQCRTYLQLLL